MKKFQLKLLIALTSCFALLQSCSKSDSSASSTAITGGDAFRMQIVTITLPNISLPNEEYHGSISNIAVTLRKCDDHKLIVMIPSTAALGNQNLVINDLNNTTITYNVKEVVLSTTPDATIADMQTNLSTFQQTLATSNPQTATTQQAISNFNTIYSNASAENKTKIASFYKANKALVDDIILNNYSNITGRYNHDALVYILKHKAAVLAMASGLYLTIIGPGGIERAAGIVLLAIGFNKAVGYGQQFAEQTTTTIQLELAGNIGINNKNANATNNTAIALTNNVATTLPFNTMDRTVITADSNKTESGMALFFNYFNMLNGYVSQVNPIIQWVNSNVPFANFSLFFPETVPSTSTIVTSPMDTATFQHLTFSISETALKLESASLSSNGQLSLNVKIVGTATTPIQSSLKYSYTDDYSTFSGSLPITVSSVSPCDDTTTPYPVVTIGGQIWMQKNLNVCKYRNGDDIPQVQDPTAWAALTTGAWCYYNNDTANGTVYGKLYNWYAVTDPRGLAPTGWHVPTDAEWSTLINCLDPTANGGANTPNVAGGAMKENGTTHWYNPNTGATNSSGFTGLPGGYRNGDGPFYYVNTFGCWWSSSETDTTSAWNRYLNNDTSHAASWFYVKTGGFSVRCIKD